MEPQLLGGITLIVHFLGAKELDNSKGGEPDLTVISSSTIFESRVLLSKGKDG